MCNFQKLDPDSHSATSTNTNRSMLVLIQIPERAYGTISDICMRVLTCVQSRICIQCGAQGHVGVHTSPAAYTSATQQLTKTQLRHRPADGFRSHKRPRLRIRIHMDFQSWVGRTGSTSRFNISDTFFFFLQWKEHQLFKRSGSKITFETGLSQISQIPPKSERKKDRFRKLQLWAKTCLLIFVPVFRKENKTHQKRLYLSFLFYFMATYLYQDVERR